VDGAAEHRENFRAVRGVGMKQFRAVVPGGAGVSVLAGPVWEKDGTRERILGAAMSVIRTVGNGQFSVQKVARAAGVYQGNITYYWPRRRDLVVALAGRIAEQYRGAYAAACSDIDRRRDDWAEVLVRWMLADAMSEDRLRLLPELWSMANADAEVAGEVTRVYDEVADVLLEAIGVAEGDAGYGRLRVALMLTCVSAQGLMAAHGHRSSDDPVLAELREGLVALHAPLLVAALEGRAELPR